MVEDNSKLNEINGKLKGSRFCKRRMQLRKLAFIYPNKCGFPPTEKAFHSGMKLLQSQAPALLDPVQLKALAAYQGLLELKRYSSNTIRNYTIAFQAFLRAFPGQKPSEITKPMIMDWLLREVKAKGWSESNQNTMINAIKFFYEKLLNRPREY